MKKRTGGGNAFDMLMKKRPKKTQPLMSAQKSRFVTCPAGCGSHIPEHQVNIHLDTCLGSSANETLDSATPEPGTSSETIAITNENVSDEKEDPASLSKQQSQTEKAQPQSSDSSSAATISPEAGPNAFAHMMKQSHRVFSVKEPLHQRFHLHADGRLEWTNMEESSSPESWSAKVTLKASRMLHGESSKNSINGPQLRDVELTISSFIPSGTATTRLVKQHSRLSVSVDYFISLFPLLIESIVSPKRDTGTSFKIHFAKIHSTTPSLACGACGHGANGQGNGRTIAAPSHYHFRRFDTSS
jgi:hypothetical protein